MEIPCDKISTCQSQHSGYVSEPPWKWVFCPQSIITDDWNSSWYLTAFTWETLSPNCPAKLFLYPNLPNQGKQKMITDVSSHKRPLICCTALDIQQSFPGGVPFDKEAVVSEVKASNGDLGEAPTSSCRVTVTLHSPTYCLLSRNSSWTLVDNWTLFLIFSIIAPLTLLGIFS